MRQQHQGNDPVSDRIEGSGRPALDRARIVTAALTVIDSSGVEALTMRRLGSVLGVEAMSLYRYVVSREALLDAVVEEVMAGLDADPEASSAPDDGWADRVVRLSRGVRRIAVAHPRAFPLVASRPTAAPFLRPPLRTLDRVEALLRALSDEGFKPPAAVSAYHAVSSFLVGRLLLEVGPPDQLTGPDDPHDALDGVLRDYPTLSALGGELDHEGADEEFEAALGLLVEQLARLRDG